MNNATIYTKINVLDSMRVKNILVDLGMSNVKVSDYTRKISFGTESCVKLELNISQTDFEMQEMTTKLKTGMTFEDHLVSLCHAGEYY